MIRRQNNNLKLIILLYIIFYFLMLVPVIYAVLMVENIYTDSLKRIRKHPIRSSLTPTSNPTSISMNLQKRIIQ